MKLLLVNPSYSTNLPISLSVSEPLGLAYLAAAIQASGRHEVEIFDAFGSADSYEEGTHERFLGISHEETVERIAELSFDALGVTTSLKTDVVAIVRLLRERFPKVPLILGGPEISEKERLYSEFLDFDYAVIGEGEVATIDLLDALEGRKPIREVRGIVYREDGEVIRAPTAEPADFEALPWPARNLLRMEHYFEHKAKYARTPAISILTSRTCPFSCPFCSIIEVWGRKYRARSPEQVVDEMEHLIKEYGVQEFRIQDDNFVIKRDRAERICDLIIERKLDVALHVEPGVMLHLASKELLQKLRRAGLFTLTMQLESGLPKSQKYINKHVDMDRAKEMVAFSQSLGLTVGSNVLIGFPDENKEEMYESARNAMAIGYDSLYFVAADPYYGTRLYRDAVEHGLIEPGKPRYKTPIDTLHASAQDVQEVLDWARAEWVEVQRGYPLKERVGRTYTLPRAPREDTRRRARLLSAVRRGGDALKSRLGLLDADAPEIGHGGGFSYFVELPDAVGVGDTDERPKQSQVVLYEDGKPLGPGNCGHDSIRSEGEGRFSHWQRTLFFSASDNSDPRTNGRHYVLHY